MKQSTEYQKNTWLARCRYGDCNEDTVECPVCKKPGHVTTHIMNENGKGDPIARVSILHSHFLENVDAGRNMYCETKHVAMISDLDLKKVVRLKPDAKRRIIKEYARRLK
jgi:hypothetical protein